MYPNVTTRTMPVPRFHPGDVIWVLDTKTDYVRRNCKICQNTRKIELKGKPYECPACLNRKSVLVWDIFEKRVLQVEATLGYFRNKENRAVPQGYIMYRTQSLASHDPFGMDLLVAGHQAFATNAGAQSFADAHPPYDKFRFDHDVRWDLP